MTLSQHPIDHAQQRARSTTEVLGLSARKLLALLLTPTSVSWMSCRGSPRKMLSMSPSTPPESPPTARTQFFVGGIRLRPSLWTRHSQRPTLIRFMWNPLSGSPDSLIRYNLLSCLPPLADLTRHSTLPSRRRLLLPSFRPSRLPFSPSDISTVASGHLHRQDSHLLERQLASLHERTEFETSSPVDSARIAARF